MVASFGSVWGLIAKCQAAVSIYMILKLSDACSSPDSESVTIV